MTMLLKSKKNAPKNEKSKPSGDHGIPPDHASNDTKPKLESKNIATIIKIDLVTKTKIQLLLRACRRKRRSIFNLDVWDLIKDLEAVFP